MANDWAFGTVTSTNDVSTTPQRILKRARVARSVTITVDFPIRVLDDASVNADRGMYVDTAVPFRWPQALGPEVELWAVRAGNNNAKVSVVSQKVPLA